MTVSSEGEYIQVCPFLAYSNKNGHFKTLTLGGAHSSSTLKRSGFPAPKTIMKLGADPEFFVLDETNSFINASKVLNYSKNKPIKFLNETSGFYDNVLLELNILPANNISEFVTRCYDGMHFLRNHIGSNKLSLHAYAEFDSSELRAKNAKEYGCVSDTNAYTLTENELPVDLIKNSCMRTAGGHIHIGGTAGDAVCNPVLKPLYVFMLDLFVAIPGVLIDNSAESYRRRSYFGRAGAYRDKEYGIEYRVLSPFWLRSESTIAIFYLLCDFVFHEMNENIYQKFFKFEIAKLRGNSPETAYCSYGYDVQNLNKAINTNNYSLARKYFNFATNFMPNKIIKLVEEEINNPKRLVF